MGFVKLVSVLLMISAVSIGFVPNVWAAERDLPKMSERVTLDGKPYNKKDLIEDFISVAFSEKPFPDYPNDFSENSSENMRDSGGGAQGELAGSWLQEYIVRSKGYPNPQGINKWTEREVSVGFDWPMQRKGLNQKVMDRHDPEHPVRHICPRYSVSCHLLPEIFSADRYGIAAHINALIPSLEQSTGIKFHLQLPDSPKEAEGSDQYARIRILFVDSNRMKNFFKFYRAAPHEFEHSYWSLKDNEWELQNSLSYTANTRSQVDGYLLPQADNSLGMAVCMIVSPQIAPSQLVKSLITECLVRSLGLPDLSKNPESALGNWNKIYDPYSKIPDLDGRDISVNENRRENILKDFPRLQEEVSRLQYSEYDRQIMKLLYCSKIRPGMLRSEVRAILQADANSDNNCFSK